MPLCKLLSRTISKLLESIGQRVLLADQQGTDTAGGDGGGWGMGAGGRRVEYEMHMYVLYNKTLSLLSQERVRSGVHQIGSRYRDLLEMQSCISSA